jgi:mRNA interferase HicA
MKRRDLERKLKEYGWSLKYHGGSHDKWTNGQLTESIPRHNEINENLAMKIIKKAKENPCK